MRKTDRVLWAAAALTIVVYFWRLVRPTLHVFFSDDDMMNLDRAWDAPLGALVKANFFIWESNRFGRPFASAWYRIIYHFAGLHPVPFHAALLVLLFLNLFLTYAVCRRLSGSREIAAVTALLGCYSNRQVSLYFDTGFVFDVLCYCLYFAIFLFYIRARQQERFLKGWEIAVVVCLGVCALNSKEMAVSLPLFLLIYELLYHPPKSWRAPEWRQWLTIGITGAITAVFIVGRRVGPDTLLTNEMYQPHFTWTQFMLTSRHFLGDMLERSDNYSSVWVLLLWGAMFAIAWTSRSRCLKFAWLFLMLAPLPIAFLYPRGPAQYYLPWFGWVLFAAAALVGALEWLTGRRRTDPLWTARIRGAVTLLILVALLYSHYKRALPRDLAGASDAATKNRWTVSQMKRLYPSFPRKAKVLFLNDSAPPDTWNMLFIMQLAYGDNTMTIDCARRIGRPDDAKIATYDHVFDYVGGRYFELQRPWRRPTLPMIVVNESVGQFFHSNWVLVTPAYPAEVGERLISQAADLGPTDPPVPDGKPFPGDPLLRVKAKVEVRVAGRPAQVGLKIGWPSDINHYRLDFTVPAGVPHGPAKVEVTADGLTGWPAELPVQ